jgi:hypothetical protein
MKRPPRYHGVALLVLVLTACAHGPDDARLVGTWTNHHRAARQRGVVSIAFLPQNTVTIELVDALAAAGSHKQTTATGQYTVIAPGELKLTEEIGSAVLEYRIDGTRLTLSGQGLARVLGSDVPPQALDKGE